MTWFRGHCVSHKEHVHAYKYHLQGTIVFKLC